MVDFNIAWNTMTARQQNSTLFKFDITAVLFLIEYRFTLGFDYFLVKEAIYLYKIFAIWYIIVILRHVW